MTVALVRTSPLELIQVPGGDAIDVAIAGIEAAAVSAGWSSPDGVFAVVPVVPFDVPKGRVASGDPLYSIVGGAVVESYALGDEMPPPLVTVLSQDLMAQFTPDDASKIQNAVTTNPEFWLLWSSLQAQKDPMQVSNARFKTGWTALIAVLGPDRMAAIASALGLNTI